jgi:GTP-binding protein EngB required for normal cell division
MSEAINVPETSCCTQDVLNAIQSICRHHGISALEDFVSACRSFEAEEMLSIAVLGRFKAGKSSFLNHLMGRPLLPVGVIPVTAVVTEIQYGPAERAEVQFLDGRSRQVPVGDVGTFISETGNPENQREVERVRVELPSLKRYDGIRFIDTPGLESVLDHNSHTVLDWLPNVGMALVAVGVAPPLTEHDIELIARLRRYTLDIRLLLTKVDLLEAPERMQVMEYVQSQLGRHGEETVRVYPFSVKPGFEYFREQLEGNLLLRVPAAAKERRAAILHHKLDALSIERSGYLRVALRSAETADSERTRLRLRILGEKEALDDARMALRLVARHEAGECRSRFEVLLECEEAPVRARLLAGLDAGFPTWKSSLAVAVDRFEEWLRARLTIAMATLSGVHREEFLDPVRHVARQLSQTLQDFRNRLSERMLETLGVPLRTTEMELRTQDPRAPDVRVGRIFDHNWELASFLAPMTLLHRAVKRHFKRKVEDAVFVNLSRLVSQWEDVASASIGSLEREAARRLDNLIETVEKLVAAAGDRAPRIREDLEALGAWRERLAGSEDLDNRKESSCTKS